MHSSRFCRGVCNSNSKVVSTRLGRMSGLLSQSSTNGPAVLKSPDQGSPSYAFAQSSSAPTLPLPLG